MPNIKFIYLYRDGGNYKKWAEITLHRAHPTEEAYLRTRLLLAYA